MNAINFGVWGLGRIGLVHCDQFSRQRGLYSLSAVCDLAPERVAKAAAENTCAGYEDAASFLADPKVELVIIATRSLDHVAHAAQALAAGKRVLLEKPVAVTAKDLRKLEQLDRDYPGMLFCGHNHRFEPAFEHIQKIIASGVLGSVHSVKIRRHHSFRRRCDWQALLACGGGQLSCWGPHVIDHALQFIQAPVRQVWSRLQRINSPGDADDHFKILLAGENGVVVDAEASDAVAVPDAYCSVDGTRGSLVSSDERTLKLKYIESGHDLPEISAEAGLPPEAGGQGHADAIPWREEEIPVEPRTNMWEHVEVAMARHLYQALRNGVPFPVTNAQAMETVRIIEIVKSQNPQFAWAS
ncbi:MAG: Gfo/Idh/MocA family oxidoreductase [Verrucomicrobiota bacterium]